MSQSFKEPGNSFPHHKRPPAARILSQINLFHDSKSHFFKIILILSSHSCLGLASGLFPSHLSNRNPAKHLSCFPHVPHSPPISFHAICSPEYLLRSEENTIEFLRPQGTSYLFHLTQYLLYGYVPTKLHLNLLK